MSTLKRTDRHDTERSEFKLIRVGHALWALMLRDRARNRGYLPEIDPVWEALETVWQLKREHRAELAAKRQVQSTELRARFARAKVML